MTGKNIDDFNLIGLLEEDWLLDVGNLEEQSLQLSPEGLLKQFNRVLPYRCTEIIKQLIGDADSPLRQAIDTLKDVQERTNLKSLLQKYLLPNKIIKRKNKKKLGEPLRDFYQVGGEFSEAFSQFSII